MTVDLKIVHFLNCVGCGRMCFSIVRHEEDIIFPEPAVEFIQACEVSIKCIIAINCLLYFES